MRNTTRRKARPETSCPVNFCSSTGKPQVHREKEAAALPCEVLATIHLPKGKRINIGRALDNLLDALAVEGSVGHIDAVLFRVVRGGREGAVKATVIPHRTPR
jgi:hypothetical protein